MGDRPAQGEGHGGPARGYRWADAEPGNELALKHGAFSPRKVDPVALELVDAVLAQPDTSYLRSPSYLPTLWAWARAEARVRLLTAWLEDVGGQAGGLLDNDGEVRGAARFLDRCEASAGRLRSQLGLDPLSRAKLGRDEAAARIDMAKLMAALNDDDQEDDGGDDDG